MTTARGAPGRGVTLVPSDEWQIVEAARRPWDGPRNDFGRIAFDRTGVWFLPQEGPLIRAPLPRE